MNLSPRKIICDGEGYESVAGSTFCIYLPAEEYNDVGAGVPTETPDETPGETAAATNHRETILLVEDETALLHLTQKMLESKGYRVLSAESPMEAIRIAASHDGPIELLLTDVIMPEMNGRDLATKIQANYPSLRCLFTSGYAANVITDRGILSSDVNFLQKPFRKIELFCAVKSALESDA